VVHATAIGLPPQRGPRSRIADRIIALSSRLGLGRAVLVPVSVILLMTTYTRQLLTRSVPVEGALFVGIRALRERELVRQFETMQAGPVVHLDERGLTDFFRQARVPLLKLLREMQLVWSEVREHLHSSPQSEGLDRKYLLSFFLMHGHRFTFLRAWFRHYRSQPGASSVVACTAASALSYAPVAAGFETIYMLHGFQRRSLIYPDFARAICFNGIEAEHLQRRLPQCAVTLAAEPAQRIATGRIAAVAGDCWDDAEQLDRIRPFMDWALRNDLPVIVRRHPADASGYWDRWRGVAGVEVTDGEGGFAEFLERFRPRLLAGWFSTALYDAIVKGIVPVTVTTENDEATLDTVFPFRELSLRWPQDEKIAERLLDDERSRAEFLTDAYARAMAADCSDLPDELPAARQAGV